MLRMLAPPGLASFSHQGHPFEIQNGAVQIDNRHRADFEAHGFVEAAEGKVHTLAPPEALTPRFEPGMQDTARIEAVEHLASLDTTTLLRLVAALKTEDDKRPGAIESPVAKPALVISEPETGEENLSAGKLTEEQIAKMTKAQMTAWLKERDIPVVPPIDNDILRAKVKRANQG